MHTVCEYSGRGTWVCASELAEVVKMFSFRRRSNVGVFCGISVLVVGLWFSFLLGTLYASRFETGVSRQHRSHTDPVDCRCTQEDDREDRMNDEGQGVADMVLVDRKVSREPGDPTQEDNVPLKQMADSGSFANYQMDNVTTEHEDYHLTWTKVESTATNLFSAYYDARPAMHGPSIVLPGYQHKKHRNQTLFCLFRHIDGSNECSQRKSILMEMDKCNEQKEFDKKTERQFLHIFHVCTLSPSSGEEELQADAIPSHVALSADADCTSSSSFIPVYKHRPKKKTGFGVCIQTPAFGKSAKDFVSFIELHKMLGVQFFTLYSMNIDHATLAMLRDAYGGKNGILDVVHWTKQLREKEPIHYYGEVLAIHDCLYRNMYRIKYLAFVDLDEAIIPRRYNNWREMLNEIDQPYLDSFIFPNTIFMKTDIDSMDTEMLNHWNSKLCHEVQLPTYLTSFSRVQCTFNYFSRSKLIVKPELIIDTDIHGVCTRVGNTTHYLVPGDSALSQHYRAVPTVECRKNRKTRKYPTHIDNWMAQYAEPLLNVMRKRLCKNNLHKIV